MKRQFSITRYIHTPAEIQDCMKHRHGLALCHIDLIQHRKAALFCRSIHRSRPKSHCSVAKGICSDQRSRIHIYMKRNIPPRSCECRREIFCQKILSGRFLTYQKNIFSAQQSRHRLLPDVFSIIDQIRIWNPVLFLHRILLPEF